MVLIVPELQKSGTLLIEVKINHLLNLDGHSDGCYWLIDCLTASFFDVSS